MDARQVKSISDAREIVSARSLSHVKIGFVDLDGVLRGKYIAINKFFASLESGVKFCDVVFGWDSNDQLYDSSTFTGWHTAFPDATLRIDPTTCRNVQGEGDMLFFLGEFEGDAAGVSAPPARARHRSRRRDGVEGVRCGRIRILRFRRDAA
jgi:glutamine synthetase